MYRMLLSVLLAATAAIVTSGCATTSLQPASSAQLVNGDEDAAVARAEGVEVIVETNDWSAFPQWLDREMTPLRTTITNNSDHPLKVSYESFVLSGVPGATYTPLPPLDIQGTAVHTSHYPVYRPRFIYDGFLISPFYDPYIVHLTPWALGWRYDPLYYDRYYPRWRVDLPTRDMVELAIPEGVVEPEGQISGYLYFPDIEEEAEPETRLTFTADLVDAKSDTRFGSVSIPLVVDE